MRDANSAWLKPRRSGSKKPAPYKQNQNLVPENTLRFWLHPATLQRLESQLESWLEPKLAALPTKQRQQALCALHPQPGVELGCGAVQ